MAEPDAAGFLTLFPEFALYGNPGVWSLTINQATDGEVYGLVLGGPASFTIAVTAGAGSTPTSIAAALALAWAASSAQAYVTAVAVGPTITFTEVSPGSTVSLVTDANAAKMVLSVPTTTLYTDLTAWIVRAVLRFTPSRFGLQWPMAAYLYAAHMLTLHAQLLLAAGAGSETRGPVTSESIGDVSRSYGSVAFSSASIPASLMGFMTTRYGIELVGIILSRSATHARVITDWPWSGRCPW